MKKDWKKSIIPPSATVREAIETISAGRLQITFVLEKDLRLLGTITDGDIRRGILKGISLEESIQSVINLHPITVTQQATQKEILSKMNRLNLHHMPVVDDQKRVLRVEYLDELIQPKFCENWVICMAGGLGSRLQPLTNDIPKPLLKVGNKPLLETILENFIEAGFHRFYFSVNYKAEMIEDYFGDGAKWGIELRYLREKEPLGTAGALSLLEEKLEEPFLVMNSDLLTKVNFESLLSFHIQHKAQATMCVREYDFQVPYGVISLNHHQITEIREKPIHQCFVNAGIYVLQPEVLDYIPQQVFFDMPSLFERLIEEQQETIAFPIQEYWMDIGQKEDFVKANGEFEEVFFRKDK